jgi:uncharacterized Zn-binding protein involved in type VI secretion
MPGVARKGDTDDFGHSIDGGCVDTVKINGQPVAVKGSTMDDGVSITSGCIDTVKINGTPIAVKGSTTEKHMKDPGKKQPGTIQNVANDVSASG